MGRRGGRCYVLFLHCLCLWVRVPAGGLVEGMSEVIRWKIKVAQEGREVEEAGEGGM